MMKRKVVLTGLLCVLLVLALTACGGEQTTGTGGNAGGTIGGNNDQNGENQNGTEGEEGNGGEETIAPGQKPFEQGDGDSLKEFAGLWAEDRGNGVYWSWYIREDGTWGIATFDGDEPRGMVKYEDGKFLFAEGGGDWWSVKEFTVDKDGNLAGPDGALWCRYNVFYPKIEVLGEGYVGYWKMKENEQWLVIERDSTWKFIDANGKILESGYVGGREERAEDIYLICDSGSVPVIKFHESDDELYGDRGRVMRTVSIPGSDQISPLYSGIWKFSELDIMVHVREDYTWATYSPYQELIAEGKLEPNTEGNTITMAVDGKNEMVYEQYDVGVLYGDGDGNLDRLDTTDADLTIEEKFLGIWQFDWLRQYITIKEDGTWTAMDHKGNAVNGGTVVVKESMRLCGYSEDTQVIILMPDEEGYPLVLNESYGALDQMAATESHNNAPKVEEIPATAKYAGMYLWASSERYIRVDLKGNILDTYQLDGTYWNTSYSYYKFDVETGEMSMMISNNKDITLFPMEGGGWADASGNPEIVPVSFVPSLDAWGKLPIEDAWYYAAKDIYLTFETDFGFASDGPLGACLVMDENGKNIGRGKITYGPEAIYTVVVEDAGLNIVLTLNSDGKLTDAEGNELVKAHDMKYRN